MLSRRSCWLRGVAGLAASAYDCSGVFAQPVKPRPDLADMAAGVYDGDVISDARGSSRSNVRLTVVKTGPNTVYVTATYPRLPPFSAKLTRAMNTIQKVGGPGVFLLDLSKSPHGLDVTVDDASWSGTRSY
ncbi:MAG: hypothetical protein QOH05_597 [Acetobacteraceae bacterium]|jgi:hypothetical protein|nr:hypothetical protein [Acetobacteraceae bacterium]